MPIPNSETELEDFAGSQYFFSLYFSSAYWQVPLHPWSFDACRIIAPYEAFESTRVLDVLKNATAHFQHHVPECFSSIQQALKAWLCVLVLHSKTEGELLLNLQAFFAICGKVRHKLSAKKCSFYQKSVNWCGRKIYVKGFELDPRTIKAIGHMHFSIIADELCHIVHCCCWMATSIPNFHSIADPLVYIMEKANKSSGKRKRFG